MHRLKCWRKGWNRRRNSTPIKIISMKERKFEWLNILTTCPTAQRGWNQEEAVESCPKVCGPLNPPQSFSPNPLLWWHCLKHQDEVHSYFSQLKLGLLLRYSSLALPRAYLSLRALKNHPQKREIIKGLIKKYFLLKVCTKNLWRYCPCFLSLKLAESDLFLLGRRTFLTLSAFKLPWTCSGPCWLAETVKGDFSFIIDGVGGKVAKDFGFGVTFCLCSSTLFWPFLRSSFTGRGLRNLKIKWKNSILISRSFLNVTKKY